MRAKRLRVALAAVLATCIHAIAAGALVEGAAKIAATGTVSVSRGKRGTRPDSLPGAKLSLHGLTCGGYNAYAMHFRFIWNNNMHWGGAESISCRPRVHATASKCWLQTRIQYCSWTSW